MSWLLPVQGGHLAHWLAVNSRRSRRAACAGLGAPVTELAADDDKEALMTSSSSPFSALRRLSLHVSHYALKLPGRARWPGLFSVADAAPVHRRLWSHQPDLRHDPYSGCGRQVWDQHSIIRYQSQAASGCYGFDLRTFRSTTLLTMEQDS